MKIKNDSNLPKALVHAAMNDSYSRGAADISVTALIDAPRQHIMAQAYTGDMAPTIDVSKRIWPLLGTAFHNLMDGENTPDVTKEERLFMECNGWVVSGAIDRQIKRGRKVDIEDFKVTSVYTYMGAEAGDKEDWKKQLNLYANLVEANGREVKDLFIVALLRDWRPMEANTKQGYPQSPIMRLKIQKDSKAARKAYMEERVALHQEAQMLWDTEGTIVECSDEERWYAGDKYAVLKKGQKRAQRLFDSEEDARNMVATMGGPLVIEHRPGANRRCEGYCDYAGLCGQWRRIQDDAVVNQVMEGLENG